MKQNAAQAPDEGGRDFGTRYIDVDLTEQHARFYGEDGAIVWESDIVSGKPADGRDTPQGTYYIKTNDGKSVLRGYKPEDVYKRQIVSMAEVKECLHNHEVAGRIVIDDDIAAAIDAYYEQWGAKE